jgi:DnaK suppressor protein
MKRAENYRPSESEAYMSALQLTYFRGKLIRWRNQLIQESLESRRGLRDTHLRQPDVFDTASSQTELAVDLTGLARQKVQLSLIDRALTRIENRDYGFCEMTGEPIGLKRLEAQPVATLCVEAQEILERSATSGKGRGGSTSPSIW